MSVLGGKNKKKNHFLRAVGFAAAVSLLLFLGFSGFEPALSEAAVDTDDTVINLTVDSTISLNDPTSPVNLGTITGTGSVTGNTTWTVTTNDSDGWKLEVEASTTPAMASGGNSFADYTEAAEGTPETWSIAASASEFGFGATGTYIETKYGADKYMGFNGTTNEQVSHQNAETAGSDTVIIFKAEVGASKSQPTGVYQTTVTATATTL